MDADGNLVVESFAATEAPEIQINILTQSIGAVRAAASGASSSAASRRGSADPSPVLDVAAHSRVASPLAGLFAAEAGPSSSAR